MVGWRFGFIILIVNRCVRFELSKNVAKSTYMYIHVVYRFHISKTWRKKYTPNPIQWRAFYIHAYVIEALERFVIRTWDVFNVASLLLVFFCIAIPCAGFFSLSNIMYCIMWHFVWCVATMWAWSVWSVGAYVMTNRKRESENRMHAGRCS